MVKEVLKISDDLKMNFHMNYFKPTTYERIAKKVGFQDFKWVNCTVGDDVENPEYWANFEVYCGLILFEAKACKTVPV